MRSAALYTSATCVFNLSVADRSDYFPSWISNRSIVQWKIGFHSISHAASHCSQSCWWDLRFFSYLRLQFHSIIASIVWLIMGRMRKTRNGRKPVEEISRRSRRPTSEQSHEKYINFVVENVLRNFILLLSQNDDVDRLHFSTLHSTQYAVGRMGKLRIYTQNNF